MKEFDRLREIVATLRSDHGCPWDRVQTHESIKDACIEEAAEVICGINILNETGDSENLKEELGDLLFQVMMHAQIAEEEGLFSIEDVVEGISRKMVYRHPHVFGEDHEIEMLEVPGRWEQLKKKEKSGREWENAYLLHAFEESAQMLSKAEEKKRRKLNNN